MTAQHPVLSADPSSRKPSAAVGTITDLAEGQVLLPSYAEQRADGLWLNPELITNPAALAQFVDRVFAAGACFTGLDYPALCRLLYPTTPPGAPLPLAGTQSPLRLAREIRQIPAERQALYKGVKLADGGARAEYVFEPVHIERAIETPVYGEADENGEHPVIGVELSTYSEPAQLDLDEFIAQMWKKGVLAGLNLSAINAAMASNDVQRIDIARRVEPVNGKDATLNEETEALHRDDSPRLLPNGRVDLHQFKNRFPQISAGTRLMRKVTKHHGQMGVDLAGRHLEPNPPRDFNLIDMAGPGTVIESNDQGEFIVAAVDGFLNIDVQSQLISVTDKIINRDGISARTTGNLSLAGDQFEEHGEVQERRSVEGKHMTFHSDVFGAINSSGGQVILKANLSGGKIHDTCGQVSVEGRASQSVIEARGGQVVIGYAEGCTIVGAQVTVKRAMSCTIVADEVHIEDASACAIAGRRVHIGRSGARRDVDTLVSMAVPDYAAIDKSLKEERLAVAELAQRLLHKQTESDTLVASPELKSYLSVQARVRSGKIKLNDVQEQQLQQLTQRLARPLQHMRALRAEIQELGAEIGIEQDEITALETRRRDAAADLNCTIDEVYGATTIRTMAVAPGAPILATAGAAELKQALREGRGATSMLFHNDSGQFTWQYPLPEA